MNCDSSSITVFSTCTYTQGCSSCNLISIVTSIFEEPEDFTREINQFTSSAVVVYLRREREREREWFYSIN